MPYLLVVFGLSLMILSLYMRSRRTGISIWKAPRLFAPKASLSPLEYWLNRIGFVILAINVVLAGINGFQQLRR